MKLPLYPVDCRFKDFPVTAKRRNGAEYETPNYKRLLEHAAKQEKAGGEVIITRRRLEDPVENCGWEVVETADIQFTYLLT